MLCTTSVIPTKAGIQRGRLTECKVKRLVQTPFNSPLDIKGEGCAQHPTAKSRPPILVSVIAVIAVFSD